MQFKQKKPAKISALSSRNVGKYEFLTNEDILMETELLEKTSKIFAVRY